MRYIRFALAALVCAAPALSAQKIQPAGLELRPFVGAYVPTSAMRDDFKNGTTFGAQVAYELSENFHLVSTLGWTYGHNKYIGYGVDVTHIWQYDFGAEMNLVANLSDEWMLRPFVGVGGGGRTYDHQARPLATSSCTAGYGAIGTELQANVMAFRVEARDYLTCFQSPITQKQADRTDIGLMFGFAYHLR
jgi:opacity protein-like surface antigen